MKNTLKLLVALLQGILRIVKPKSVLWFVITIVLLLLQNYDVLFNLINQIIQLF